MRTKSISWSELSCFETDQSAWYDQYILGKKEPPTPAMERGSDIHALVLEDVPVQRIYSPQEQEIHRLIRDNFDKTFNRSRFDFEVKMEDELGGVPVIGVWDGYDSSFPAILELKTGERPWTRWRANSHGQLDTYGALHRAITGATPLILLASASTKTGEIAVFEVEMTDYKIEAITKRFQDAWEEIKNHTPYVTIR